MNLRAVLLLLVFISFYLVLNYYIGYHLWMYLSAIPGVPDGAAAYYWVVFWVVAFGYMIGRAGGRWLLGAVTRRLRVVGSYYLAMIQFGILVLPVADLLSWGLRLSGVQPEVYLLPLGAGVLIVLLLLLLRGTYNAWTPIVRTYEVKVPKQAGGRRQLRIAAASDLHLGTVVGNKHLGRLVEIVRGLKPDLILLPGDIIDDVIEPFVRENMAELMKELRAPLGTYAVLGNHEYYGGHIPELVKRLDAVGIRVLQDEHVLLDGSIYVAGRKDRTAEGLGPGGRQPVDALLSGLDHEKPIILMDHQPYQLDKAAAAGADVQLSGHTHRGQIMPNHLITRRIFEVDWGYLRKGNLHAIVSSGFGSWGPPIRIGSRAEVLEVIVSFE